MAETVEYTRSATAGDSSLPRGAAYSVSNSAHFLGAVALVNSLRLTGWRDEIVLVDGGLTKRQRALLGSEAIIISAPRSLPPHLLKVFGPLTHPAEAMVLIDADMIVVGSLDALLVEAVTSTRLLAVADILHDRYDARWGDLLGLGELRRQTYVNSGFVVAPRELGGRVFTQLERLQGRIDPGRSMIAAGRPDDPFFFLDQDALNALLASTRFRREDLHVLDQSRIPLPPFAGVRILDQERLRVVSADGGELIALHHYQRKPWLQPLAENAYSRLLPRLWLAGDLPIRLQRHDVPLRFRPGMQGRSRRAVRSRLCTGRTGATHSWCPSPAWANTAKRPNGRRELDV